MPFINNGAARALCYGVSYQNRSGIGVYISLHSAAVASEHNELGGNGYRRQSLASYGQTSDPNIKGFENITEVAWRATGTWLPIRSIALREHISGSDTVYAYATLPEAVTLEAGDEYRVGRGDIQLSLTEAAMNAAGAPAGSADDWAYYITNINGGGLNSTASYINLHAGYPTGGNRIGAYPSKSRQGVADNHMPQGGAFLLMGNVITNREAIEYQASAAERAAPLWWSLARDANANQILLVGQVDASQAAVPAGTSFAIAVGEISITIEDA